MCLEKGGREIWQRRNNWRAKGIHDAGEGRGFSVFVGVLLAFEAQALNIEGYTKVAAAIYKAIQWYQSHLYEKKIATTQTPHHLIQEGR